jgi:hypothetical protein
MAFDSLGNLFFTDSDINTKVSGESEYSDLNELPTSTVALGGFGGVTTGYAATPTVLYTYTPSTPAAYDDQLDAVAVGSDGTVYLADEYNGILAFPNNAGVVDTTNKYMVSTQGSKLLTMDASGNFYGASYSAVMGASGDTLFQATVNKVTAPSTAVGSSSTNSATINPITTILNGNDCSSGDTVSGFPSTNADFSAAVTSGATCSSTTLGGSAWATTLTFTPTAAVSGTETSTLTATDTDANTATVTASGVAQALTAQTITFTTPVASEAVPYGIAPISLGATATSGLAVTFSLDASSTAGAASLSSGVLTITGVGSIVIDANQAGDATYAAAPQAQVTITVAQATQTIAFTAPASPVTVGASITLSATGGASGNAVGPEHDDERL